MVIPLDTQFPCPGNTTTFGAPQLLGYPASTFVRIVLN